MVAQLDNPDIGGKRAERPLARYANPDIGGKQAGLVVARLDNPDIGGKQAGQDDHKPGWKTPMSVVSRQGDHKGRPYGRFSCTLYLLKRG